MDVRLLTDEDAEAYRKLRLEALLLEPTAFGSSHEEELRRDLDVTRSRIRPGDTNRVYGAFEDGRRLVGVAGLRRNDGLKETHKGFVWGVYVTLAARRKGTGLALMHAVLGAARDMRGLERLTIAVNAANEPARRLYERLDFEPYGLEPDALRVGGEKIDELWMTLRLVD